MEEPENTKNTGNTGRNLDGTWKPGFCPNPGGRPRNPLKDFSLKEFNSWTDEQKSEFLNKISPYDRWRMTEGNPVNNTDLTTAGESFNRLLVKFIDGQGDNKGDNNGDNNGDTDRV